MVGAMRTLANLAAVAMSISLAVPAGATAQTVGQRSSGAATLAALQQERNGRFDRFKSLGGQRGLETTQGRMALRKQQIDAIESILPKLSGGKAALERMKKQVDEKSVVGLADLVPGKKDAAKHVAGKAMEAVGTEAGSKVLGWVGLIADVVEYGGKKIIKELNVHQMEELVRENRINVLDALRLEDALLRDNNEDRRTLDKLLDAKARYAKAEDRYVAELLRQRNLSKQAQHCPQVVLSEPEKTLDFVARRLRAEKRELFKAIANAPRYGSQFVFLLHSGNFYDAHLRRIASYARLLKSNPKLDCVIAQKVRRGSGLALGVITELKIYVGYHGHNARALKSMVDRAKELNAKRFF